MPAKSKYYYIVLDYAAYRRDILETRVGPIVEPLDSQQCGLCSKLNSKVYPNWLSFMVLYSTLLCFRPVLTFALKTSISCFQFI